MGVPRGTLIGLSSTSDSIQVLSGAIMPTCLDEDRALLSLPIGTPPPYGNTLPDTPRDAVSPAI
jgi:hypothetical protein